jgi:hypothetical protein
MASTSESSRFSCASCGRSFQWKPELAGKRAKCKCGATVEVPKADPAEALRAAAPEAAGPEPSVDDVFAAAEMELAAPPPPPATRPATAAAPRASAAPAAAAYAGTLPRRAKIDHTSPMETYHSRWRGVGWLLAGALLCAYAYYEFASLGRWEMEGGRHRMFVWVRLLYALGGRWGVLVILGGFGALVALLGVLAIAGKVHIEPDE